MQGAAEVAYDMVSPETASTLSRGQTIQRRVAQQPADFRQGVANAYNVVTEVSNLTFPFTRFLVQKGKILW